MTTTYAVLLAGDEDAWEALTPDEQAAVFSRHEAFAAALAERGIEVARVLVGDYITSLDMAGCSLTLVRADDEMLRLWDAPVNTTALRWGV